MCGRFVVICRTKQVAATVEEDVVGPEVDRDEGDLALMLVQEVDGITELGARVVRAAAARDHGCRALAAAAQLDQAELVTTAVACQLEQLVGVPLVVARGRAVGVRAADRLEALRQRIAERQVVRGRLGGGRRPG
jgi:hypothetical protein